MKTSKEPLGFDGIVLGFTVGCALVFVVAMLAISLVALKKDPRCNGYYNGPVEVTECFTLNGKTICQKRPDARRKVCIPRETK